MSIITDIRELAVTARQAANDVAGSVLDVRRAGEALANSVASREVKVAQATAAMTPWNPTAKAEIDTRTDATLGMLGGSSGLLVLGLLVAVVMFARR